MASGETVDDVIRRIIHILDAASIPYMLTGSFASSLHGMPRATQDIDLVIAPNPASLEALLKNFPEDQYVVGDSDANHQIEFDVFWDSKPDGNLRIMASIDDGGLRAILPLTNSLIMKPDGTLL